MSKGAIGKGCIVGLVIVGALVLVGLVTLMVIVGGYNKAKALDQEVKKQFAQIDVVLQRRNDLIPNVVETVKGYAKHEGELFAKIAESRAAYSGATTRESKIAAANALSAFMPRLLAVVENYPNLKANQTFMALVAELEGTENRIAVERKRYNDAVRTLNTYANQIPSNWYCRLADVKEAEFLETPKAAREAPKVDFGSSGGAAAKSAA